MPGTGGGRSHALSHANDTGRVPGHLIQADPLQSNLEPDAPRCISIGLRPRKTSIDGRIPDALHIVQTDRKSPENAITSIDPRRPDASQMILIRIYPRRYYNSGFVLHPLRQGLFYFFLSDPVQSMSNTEILSAFLNQPTIQIIPISQG